ncbi:FlhDC DNA-binding transcriptional dual regulator [Escherichia coli]|nr:FlhDC DNA-binding transcriptional dual regulator [Escherichia coli]
MHTSELLKHIYDINLSYLLLAQRLIVQDKASAMFRLGINEEMATTLAALTLPQMVKLAETGNDSNLLIVFYVQIMPDDFVMQLHRF